MENKPNPQNLLKRVVKEQDFSLLSDLQDPVHWDGLAEGERELLALLFVWRGESELASGSDGVLHSFELAESAAPRSASAFYWQGMAWLKFGRKEGQERGLVQAEKKFAQATRLDPEHFGAWYGWAVALGRLGDAYGEPHYFAQADEKYQRALALAEPDRVGSVLWDWGGCWLHSATVSGEAIDLRTAIEKFGQAQQEGVNDPAFWLDYGNAFVKLAKLVGESRLLRRALDCYAVVTRLDKEDFRGWFAQARTLRKLYFIGAEETDYLRSREAFQRAAKINPESCDVWLEWTELLLHGANHRNTERALEEALEKVHRAARCVEGDDPKVLNLHIRVLIALGRLEGRLELLREAERLSKQGVIVYAENPLLWVRFGEAEMALGDYFEEERLYHAAAERFAHALLLDESIPGHMGMAIACFALGMMRQEHSLLRRCADHCACVVDRNRMHTEAWNLWGLALLRKGELTDRRGYAEQALEKFGQAIALRGGWEGNPETEWMFNYGCALDFLGTFAEDDAYHRQAVQVFSRLLFFHPEDVLIQFQLAVAWHHLGDISADPDCYARALEQLGSVAARVPDEDGAWDEWGCVLLSLAHLIDDPSHQEEARRLRAEAETKLHRAVSLGNQDALYHLAWLYTELGQHETATHFLRRAARLGSLPSLEELMHDEWLADLRNSPFFRDLLDDLEL